MNVRRHFKVAVGIFFVFLALYAAMIVLAVGAVALMIGLGCASYYLVKSKNALVQENKKNDALILSATWAAALTAGMIVGSIGLLIAFNYSLSPHQLTLIDQKYGTSSGPAGLALFLERWVIRDSYFFFVEALLLIYFTNRIFIQRKFAGSSRFLSILPPIMGFFLFFVAKNWHPIAQFFSGNLDAFYYVIQNLMDTLKQPFLLVDWLINSPQRAVNWAKHELLQSDASLFRLTRVFPEIFVVLVCVFFCRSAVSGDGASLSET